MGYWKWLYNKIKGIEKKQLEVLRWFGKTLGGILLIITVVVLTSSYFIDNMILSFIVSMVIGLFFSVTWFVYNVEKETGCL